MKLMLREKVPGLGDPGDVIEATDGYGRNYLLPQRLAVANTSRNRAILESEKVMKVQREAERIEKAKDVQKALKNALLQTHMKAQRDGSLYGSVSAGTVVEIVKNLRGFALEALGDAREPDPQDRRLRHRAQATNDPRSRSS